MATKYEIIRRDRAAQKIPDDVVHVFDCVGHDYGCADDDTRLTGVEHTSVTLDSAGAYPFFTIPKADIRRVAQ